jgi:predicted branched-subunit amino acid permease
VLGGLIGSAVHDTNAFGLDAMFPAVILALIVKDLRDARTLRAALAGAAIALVATPFLPAGLPVLLALAALLLLARAPATEASTSPDNEASISPDQEPAAAQVRTAP